MLAKSKLLFLALKGIGDTVILINFLSKYSKPDSQQILIILSKRLSHLTFLFPDYVHFKIVDDEYSCIFYLKDKIINFKYIFKLQRLVRKTINQGFHLIVYDSFVKNFLISYTLNRKCIFSNSVYKNLEYIFNLKITLQLNKKSNNYLIFPFGNHLSRQLTIHELRTIVQYLSTFNLNYRIVVHESQKELIKKYQPKKNIITYEYFSQLNYLFDIYTECITVDSSFMHLSILNNLRCIVISDSWDNYIHEDLLKSGLKISRNNINYLKHLI